MDGKPWRIELLSTIRARYRDGEWMPLSYQKPMALLLYLAAYPHRPHPRDALIELLWPGSDLEAGRLSLRVALHSMRRMLESTGAEAADLLLAERTTLRLAPGAFTTDLGEYLAAVSEAAGAQTPVAGCQALGDAAARYIGEFLPGFPDAWASEERERLMTTQREVLQRLVRIREELGDGEGALSAAREMVRLDPHLEEAHYDVMRLCAAAGQPQAVLRQYQELERILREELGESPSAEARALAEELRQGARTLVVARRSSPASAVFAPSPPRPLAPSPSPRLPAQLTRFYGRQDEIAWLTELLSASMPRLLTVTGPGGSGKTRLAIAAVGRLIEIWSDPSAFQKAVVFVALADLTDAARIPEAIADALEIERAPEAEVLEQVITQFSAQPWLLVLDNYEHLIEEGSLWVRTLLERAPSLTCLATSRQRLGIAGEQEFALLPLPTPRRGTAFEQLGDYASVQLFVDRARAVRREFSLTPENAASVAELCDRLEGLPLALELAASRAAARSPGEMLALLEKRFEFLVSRQRDLPARHRTLRATIDSSYHLLDPGPREFLTRLSVFRGGWTLTAAEAVCASPESALECTELLQECSLVLGEERQDEMRYRLLETLREYGWEQLSARGELAATRTRHRDWFLHLAEQAEPELSGPHLAEWLERLEVEHDNLRAALLWSIESGDREAELRMCAALAPFWEMRFHYTEGRQALEAALARDPAAVPDRARAKSLRGLSRLWRHTPKSRLYRQEALAVWRELGDRREIAEALFQLALAEDVELHEALATRYFQESLAIWRELGDRGSMARAQFAMAQLAVHRGAYGEARGLYQESLALNRESGDLRAAALDLLELGSVTWQQAEFTAASGYLQESLAIQRTLGHRSEFAVILFFLGRIAFDQGEYVTAAQLWEETLAVDLEKLGRCGYVAICLARLAAARGDDAGARAQYEAHIATLRQARLPTAGDIADAQIGLGDLAFRARDESAARANYEECLTFARELGYTSPIMASRSGLWHLARLRGDVAAVHAYYQQSTAFHEALTNPSYLLRSLCQLGEMAAHGGDRETASRYLARSLEGYRANQDRRGMVACFETWARVALAEEKPKRAARLCGAAAAHHPVVPSSRPILARAVAEAATAAARAVLGEDAFAIHWSEGRTMSLDQAAEFALRADE